MLGSCYPLQMLLRTTSHGCSRNGKSRFLLALLSFKKYLMFLKIKVFENLA
jgi:hypothetical protein